MSIISHSSLRIYTIALLFCRLVLADSSCATYFPTTKAQYEKLRGERNQKAKSGTFEVPWIRPGHSWNSGIPDVQDSYGAAVFR